MGTAEPIPYSGPHSEDDLNLFGPYAWLYPVAIEDRTVWMPEDNTVLRGLQYLAVKSGEVRLPWHAYCWNNRDGCCTFQFRSSPDAAVREGRACATALRPGMVIVQLPEGGALCPPTKEVR